ncbi:AraC-type transcriptional regulator [Collimonas sp. PA-H2]|uniref:AraC family transcriptional regulator ligand-binding domain-containing protein n=1 Tax=Collimonas sp. PA-H2 TaxID=1881062 RepID=UPI000C00D541|nr:AraC family transcriptional regulator ligand-binding domain-containing protein [Collimonas sp. PA-H2]PFH10067.1 AraC-type transcriptional regulator [Collimonas sp. PA-H2]
MLDGVRIEIAEHLGNASYPTGKLRALWKVAALRSNNPAIGLSVPEVTTPAIFDVAGYAMMSSENLYASLAPLICYLRLVTDDTAIELAEEASVSAGWRTARR